MRYMALIYGDQAGGMEATPEEQAAMYKAHEEFGKEAHARGAMLGGEGLLPTTSATTVRVRDGKVVVTDGPFAETKEQLGGYYLLKCNNLDEAIELAAKIPGSTMGSIEIRPVLEFE